MVMARALPYRYRCFGATAIPTHPLCLNYVAKMDITVFGLIRTTARQRTIIFHLELTTKDHSAHSKHTAMSSKGKLCPYITKGLLVRAATFYRGGLNGQKGSGP